MSWQEQLKGDSLAWLLEPQAPGVRYLALRDLLGLAQDDAELRTACQAAHQTGPIATMLAAMDQAGYWVEPGPGYNPKYRSTVWSMIMLYCARHQVELFCDLNKLNLCPCAV